MIIAEVTKDYKEFKVGDIVEIESLVDKVGMFNVPSEDGTKKLIPTNAVRIVLNKEIKNSSDSKADRVTTIFCSLIPMFLPNGMAKASYRWYKDLAALSVKIEEYIRKEVSE